MKDGDEYYEKGSDEGGGEGDDESGDEGGDEQGGSNFETIFSTRVFATIFSLFEMFVLTISSPYQKKESYVKV